MDTHFVHVGFGNMLAMNRVIGIGLLKSAPAKRAVAEAGHKGLLITLTKGRRSKTGIFMDTGHIVLTALDPDTLASRAAGEEER